MSSRRLHRGQAPLLQVARALLELACLRWRRRGVSECAASVSRASPAPTAGAGPVGAGLPAMALGCPRVRSVCIAGKPRSYRLRGLCWSWLACDGLGAVPASSRRLHRGQARLLQLAQACWSWLACDGVGGVSASSRRLYRGQDRLLQLVRALLELACLRWRRCGVSECAASVSRARPNPTAGAGSVGAGLPAMASVGCQWVRGVCIAGKTRSYSASRVGAGLPAMASVGCQ